MRSNALLPQGQSCLETAWPAKRNAERYFNTAIGWKTILAAAMSGATSRRGFGPNEHHVPITSLADHLPGHADLIGRPSCFPLTIGVADRSQAWDAKSEVKLSLTVGPTSWPARRTSRDGRSRRAFRATLRPAPARPARALPRSNRPRVCRNRYPQAHRRQ